MLWGLSVSQIRLRLWGDCSRIESNLCIHITARRLNAVQLQPPFSLSASAVECACILMFIMNRTAARKERNVVRFQTSEDADSISGYTLTPVIWPHQVITLFMWRKYEWNKEFMLLAQGTGSQTIQSNGKMSVELIYLSQRVMMPMKDNFLFVPIQTVSFSRMKISLIYNLFCVYFIFPNSFNFIVNWDWLQH